MYSGSLIRQIKIETVLYGVKLSVNACGYQTRYYNDPRQVYDIRRDTDCQLSFSAASLAHEVQTSCMCVCVCVCVCVIQYIGI